MCLWFLHISTFSMLPLLQRDGLFLATIGLSGFYLIGIKLFNDLSTPATNNKNLNSCNWLNLPERWRTDQPLASKIGQPNWLHLILSGSIVGSVIMAFVLEFTKPPVKLPHLYPLFISFYSFIHFILYYIVVSYQLLFDEQKPKKQ